VPNLALIALGDSHHSQGGMKFATQISPLLNYGYFFRAGNKNQLSPCLNLSLFCCLCSTCHLKLTKSLNNFFVLIVKNNFLKQNIFSLSWTLVKLKLTNIQKLFLIIKKITLEPFINHLPKTVHLFCLS
jgi:hypothetical protein